MGANRDWCKLLHVFFISEPQFSHQAAIALVQDKSPCLHAITRKAAASFGDGRAFLPLMLTIQLSKRQDTPYCLIIRRDHARSTMPHLQAPSSPSCPEAKGIPIVCFSRNPDFFEYVFPGAVHADSLTSYYIYPVRYLGINRLQCRA